MVYYITLGHPLPLITSHCHSVTRRRAGGRLSAAVPVTVLRVLSLFEQVQIPLSSLSTCRRVNMSLCNILCNMLVYGVMLPCAIS